MKRVLAALLCVVSLTAACTPATAVVSPTPSVAPSATPGGFAIFPSSDPSGFGSCRNDYENVLVGDKVVFDLPNTSSWSVVDVYPPFSVLDIPAALLSTPSAVIAATVVGAGEAYVTASNGTDYFYFSILAQSADASPTPDYGPGDCVLADLEAPIVLSSAGTNTFSTFILVDTRVIFALENPGDWTPTVDVPGVFEWENLTTGLVATAVESVSRVTVTMTNKAGQSVVFVIKVTPQQT